MLYVVFQTLRERIKQRFNRQREHAREPEMHDVNR